MGDIFISYAKEDRERAEVLAEALQSTGWSVFWDRTVPTGQTWRSFIGNELENARCVVVVWSAASVKSEWVLEEAEAAKKRKALIPVFLEAVEPPFGFAYIQGGDLSDWDGRAESPAIRRLVGDMVQLLGPAPNQPEEEEVRPEGRGAKGAGMQAQDLETERPIAVGQDGGTKLLVRARKPLLAVAVMILLAVGGYLLTFLFPGISDSDVREVVDRVLRADDSRAIMDLYAEEVDYYNWGTVSPERIVKDKDAYFKRYPTRTFALDGNIVIDRKDGKVIAVFPIEWSVRDGAGNSKSGRVSKELTLQRIDGEIRIVGDKEAGRSKDKFDDS